MQFRTDQKTSTELSALGLGCMRLPGSLGRIDIEASEKLVMQAIKGGVNYFDTAYLYNGSEEALGAILERNKMRDQVYIATKLPHANCKSPADFDKYFDIQKERLQTGHIDYYLIHNISDFAQWERIKQLGIEEWIAGKKQSGEIRRIGFSYHGPAGQFNTVLDAYDWDFVQIQYNYINENYQAGRAGLHAAAKRGLPVIVMEPLLGGKLATGLPAEAQRLFESARPTSTPAEWALNWLWDQPEVTVVLSGMSNEAQLAENLALAAASHPEMLSGEERQTLAAVIDAFNKSYKIPCTGCNYCMPCPKGINIPACLAAYNTSYVSGFVAGIAQYATSTGLAGEDAHLASDCIECKACESHCPQNIAVSTEMRRVKRRFQPPGFKLLFNIGRRIMS